MKVFFDECEILTQVQHSFTDKATGEAVEYNQVFIEHANEDESREVLQFNTKLDYSPQLRMKGTIQVDIDPTGKNKPRLISFQPDIT